MIADPYLNWLHGESFWDQIHSQGNDSRMDVTKLIGFALIKWTGWDLRIESLTCVAIGLMTALGLARLFSKHAPGGVRWTVASAVIGVGIVLTPHQWMNWTFGVQTCYLGVVFFTLLVVLCFDSGWSLPMRTVLAGVCAFAATHSFVNGWLAWILASACLVRKLWCEVTQGRMKVLLVLLWVGFFGLNVLVYFQNYGPGTSAAHEEPLLARFTADPMSFVNFFVRVLSAAFSDFGWGLNRDARFMVNIYVATSVTIAALTLAVAVALSGWRKLLQGPGWPFLLLCCLGLGNALAVTIARTGMVVSGPFQSRYIAFTLWFHVGLLGLLGLQEGKTWQKVKWSWLAVLFSGYLIGIPQGLRDGRRDFDRNQNMVAASALRHVAVEPVFLDAVKPGLGPALVTQLDELDHLGLLHIPTIRSPKVKDATMSPVPIAKGELKSGELQADGVFLRGWAMELASRDMGEAIVISLQPEGQDEEWLGIAQRRLIESKLSTKHRASAEEDRLGWAYKPGLRGEKATLSDAPNPFKAKTLPTGRITFRAYVMDVSSGSFTPLIGSFSAEIK